MRRFSFVIGLLMFLVLTQHFYACSTTTLISNSCIREGDRYAAFTSLMLYDKDLYCAFREANKHYDPSGVDTGHIIVLRSRDGNKWDKHCVIDCPGYDLRDPQLYIDSEKRLNLLVEKVKYADSTAVVRESCYLDLLYGKGQDLRPVDFDNGIKWNWLWNVNSINGTLFGFTYAPNFALYKSVDGRQYKHVSTPNLENQPTEGAIIDLDEKTLLAVVRQNEFAAIGKSYDNGASWQWKQSTLKLACPKLIHAKGKIILAARNYYKKTHTSVLVYNKDKDDFDVVCDLPDSGDCSYPGIVEKDGILYVSYYQSRDKSYSDIYLAKVRIN